MQPIIEVLEKLDIENPDAVNTWFSKQREIAAPHFYTSVDLRHSGIKLVPVDTNLYPAGFNNLSPRSRERASRFIKKAMDENWPDAKRVLIVPENHTRNMGYLENLRVLLELFEALDIEVRLASLAAESGHPIVLETASGRTLTEEVLVRKGDVLELEDGYSPDLIILNNDITSGAPEILRCVSQPIVPPVGMGWYRRRKTAHFKAYRHLVNAFCTEFNIDSWLMAAEFKHCANVNFKERTGLEALAEDIEGVLATVREKYAQYGIKEEPYAFIKADSGTYGMGIMTVRGGEDVMELNKKARNKMQVIKEGAQNTEVIIQEGVPTADVVDDKPAEPMVYMIDGVPIGGMYRVNASRDNRMNLNASGMEFTGMCDESEVIEGNWHMVEGCYFTAYGIVAGIAALAAAREEYNTGLCGEESSAKALA